MHLIASFSNKDFYSTLVGCRCCTLSYPECKCRCAQLTDRDHFLRLLASLCTIVWQICSLMRLCMRAHVHTHSCTHTYKPGLADCNIDFAFIGEFPLEKWTSHGTHIQTYIRVVYVLHMLHVCSMLFSYFFTSPYTHLCFLAVYVRSSSFFCHFICLFIQ